MKLDPNDKLDDPMNGGNFAKGCLNAFSITFMILLIILLSLQFTRNVP